MPAQHQTTSTIGTSENSSTTTELTIGNTTELTTGSSVTLTSNLTTTTEVPPTTSLTQLSNNLNPTPYIVYKPSTHYVHLSTCYWVDSTCYQIYDTYNLQCRRCDECNPFIEIVEEYVEPYIEPAASNNYDYNKELLAQIVYHEAGCDWINTYDKAHIVSAVINRVNDERFPNTIEEVLLQEGQFEGFYLNSCLPSDSCYEAVDYYFANPILFDNCNSWYGDGFQNYFYYQ